MTLTSPSQSTLVSRMVRAAKLEAGLYEEVEADTTALTQAFQVVLISSLAAGIGRSLVLLGSDVGIGGLLVGLVMGAVFALISWFIWAFLIHVIGTTFLRGPETSATLAEVLRTIGFANAPGVLRILMFLPFLGGIVLSVTTFWMLAAMVIAVRQALDFDIWRAVGTTLLAFFIQTLVLVALLAVAGA